MESGKWNIIPFLPYSYGWISFTRIGMESKIDYGKNRVDKQASLFESRIKTGWTNLAHFYSR